MRHMRPDQMARRECRAKRDFARKHGRANDARQLPRIRARLGGMRAAHAEHVQRRGLGVEDCAAAERADFEGGHCD